MFRSEHMKMKLQCKEWLAVTKKNVVRNTVQWVSEDHCSSGQYGVSSPMLPQWKFLNTGMNCRCIGLRKPFVTNGTLWTSWTSLYILKAWNKDDNIHVVVIYNTFNNLLAYYCTRLFEMNKIANIGLLFEKMIHHYYHLL